jgi:hypothetical protein
MPYELFQENWNTFSNLIKTLPHQHNEPMRALAEQYIEQNVMILNEVMAISIENMKRLQHATTANEVICAQAKLNNDLNKKLSLTAQRFLNSSLGHIADYNDWLKAHCDFATD